MDEAVGQQLRLIDAAILETLPLYEPIANSALFTQEQRVLLSNLSTACFRATAATLLLIEHDRVWEAEITLRSVAEGSLKFAYLLNSPEFFANRCQEYAEILPDIAILKSHERAKEILDLSSDPAAPELEPFRNLLVPDDTLETLRQKYPRNIRGKLEQSWSFSGLADSLSKSQLKAARVFRALLYGYWTSNQVTHMTWEGTSLPFERRMREEMRRKTVEDAHCSRVLSDCYSYDILRLHTGLDFVGADLAPLRKLLVLHEEQRGQSESLWKRWHNLEFPEHRW